MFKRPPALMHPRSKWVTLTLFKKGENHSLSQIPPVNATAFTQFQSVRVQGTGNVEGESRRRHHRCSPEWQQPSLVFNGAVVSVFHHCHETAAWQRKSISLLSESYLTWWVPTRCCKMNACYAHHKLLSSSIQL